MFNIFKKVYWIIFSTHQWFILYKQKNSKNWVQLKQPKNVSRADSFIVYENNKYYIFFEEFNIEKRHGYLCVGELNQINNDLDNVKTILKKDYHLSFPNVFKYEDKYYMIPESHANNTIDLYEFTVFPNKLKKIKTLIKGNYADSVLLNYNNNWFLFTNKSEDKNDLHSKNLSIFQSNSLFEDFKEYHKNPVVTDNEFVRMGGQFFIKNEKLYRVSQDCKKRYGYKVNIMEVDKLADNIYEEHCDNMIYPPKGYLAFHTLNSDKDIEVADAKIIVKTPKVVFINIINLIKIIIKKLIGKINVK
jgi:hypothetical protein